MREKEKHGNAKRKRKVIFVQRSAIMYVIGSSLSTCRKRARQGVLHAASPTSPSPLKKTEEARAQRACAQCKVAGRIKEAVGHKGSNCPYSSAIQPIVIAILLSSPTMRLTHTTPTGQASRSPTYLQSTPSQPANSAFRTPPCF